MTYALQDQYTSKNFVPGPSANNTWGLGPRRVTSITIHHWGNPGQQFNTVRDFLCTNNTPTSAHYVVQDGLVACIVSPDDCAFHAGNAEGNTFSVGIECRPEATDGDYQTIAELIAFLRGLYGDIPLHPHNYWFNTACPGDYDLTRLDTLARGTINAQGTITPEGFLMALTDAEQAEALKLLRYIADPAFKRDQLNTPVEWFGFDGKRQPAGQRNTTSLATVLGWSDAIATGQANLTNSVKAAIPTTSGTVDVTALAAQLAPLLNSATADQLLAKIKEQWTK